MRLSIFLRAAGQVMTSILAEQELSSEASKDSLIDIAQGNRSITSGCVSLPMPPVGGARTIRDVVFSKHQQSRLFVAYGEQSKGDLPAGVGGQGLLCMWDSQNTARPSHMLVCESNPVRCCFSGHRLSQTVFAATEDRSLVAWDLRESASMHINHQMDGGASKVVLRRPTYSTDGLLEDSHTGQIYSMEAIPPTAETDDLSFQLAMLDENGGLSIWNVVELTSRDMGGSLQDLSLGVGGKVKLMKSAFIDISASGSISRTISMNFRPGDPNHALIGTGHGHTLHHVRHGATAHPTQYDGIYGDAADVITIQHSPFVSGYFLTCSNDGTVCLYHESNPRPLHAWSEFTTSKLLGVLWSPSQPQIFFGYAGSGEIFVWDLVKDSLGPVHSQRLDAKSMVSIGTEDTTMIKVAFSARGVGHPYMSTSYANGCVSIHTLSGLYSNSTVNDVRHLRAFLEGVPFDSIVDEPEPVEEEKVEAQEAFDDDAFLFGDMFGGDGFGTPAAAPKQGRRAKAGRRG